MKEAILLLNMGGPNDISEVKVFLKNMFNDKAIISAPQPIRALIANKIIKNRLKEATQSYEQLGGQSPIVKLTKSLVIKLNKQLPQDIFYIMRYTPPFAYDVLKHIKHYDKFHVVPLYPHYSSTTTKSSIDHLLKSVKKLKIDKSKLNFISSYYNNPIYNNKIIQNIQQSIPNQNFQEYELIFSAHGLPEKIIQKGDPYQKHIRQNVLRLRKLLLENNINFNNTHLAYQSRVGPLEWIKPYLEDKLKQVAKKKVVIYPISFTVDNSETKFELDVEYKEIAKKIGIEEYIVVPVLNNHMSDVIEKLIEEK